jgi:hypothetical protein
VAGGRAAGGKSDRPDAFVLCELARTDNHRVRVLEPDSDQTKALRALTRGREDLAHARVALSSQLRAELERFWPGPVGLFQKLDSPISLAFLERYPSPAAAWTSSAFRRSLPASATRVTRRPRSCSQSSEVRLRAASARSSWPLADRSCWRDLTRDALAADAS